MEAAHESKSKNGVNIQIADMMKKAQK